MVLRPGALGDTLLTCAALRALRDRFPHADVELVGNLRAGRLLRAAGLVDVVTSFDSTDVTPLFGPAPRVLQRWEGVDVAVVWLASPSPVATAFLAGGAAVVVAAHPEPGTAGIHVADHLTATLKPLGISAPSTPGAALLAELAPAIELDQGRASRVVVHPGSGAPRKNWPPAAFARLAARLAALGWDVALLRGPADGDSVAAVADMISDLGARVVTPADLDGLVRELRGVRVFVGNDSGVSHLSAQLGVPTLAIFGATDPVRWAPRGPAVEVVGSLGDWPSLDQVMRALSHLVA